MGERSNCRVDLSILLLEIRPQKHRYYSIFLKKVSLEITYAITKIIHSKSKELLMVNYHEIIYDYILFIQSCWIIDQIRFISIKVYVLFCNRRRNTFGKGLSVQRKYFRISLSYDVFPFIVFYCFCDFFYFFLRAYNIYIYSYIYGNDY